MDFKAKNHYKKSLVIPLAGLAIVLFVLMLVSWNLKSASSGKALLLKDLENMEVIFEQLESHSNKVKSEELNSSIHILADVLIKLSASEFITEPELVDLHKRANRFLQENPQKLTDGKMRASVNYLQDKNELAIEMVKSSVGYYNNLATISFIGSALALLLLVILIVYQFRKFVAHPLETLEITTRNLADGHVDTIQFDSNNHFLGTINANLQLHHEHVQQLAQLSEEIGDGNFDQNEEVFEKTGALGHSIGVMREKIRLSFQNEERRRWSVEGISKFSTLVRDHSSNIDIFCHNLLSELIKFIGANQGGIFLFNEDEDEQMLVLRASYAWGRKKYLKKSYASGEGLIGQVALEKEFILLKEIPEDFVTIGSGLGDAKPTCIIILPLVAADELYGVLEIASFKIFDEHQIEFLHDVCEIFASAIATVNGGNVTRELLRQAEEANAQLKSQEEELRMNTEELMATQETMERKEVELEKLQENLMSDLEQAKKEMESQIKEIESEKIKNEAILEGCVDAVVSFNEEGNIEYFNKAAEDMWEISRREAFQVSIQEFIPVEISVANGEMLVFYLKNGKREILDARTEVFVRGKSGDQMEVLLTLTRVKVKGAYTFTAFAQKVAVELF